MINRPIPGSSDDNLQIWVIIVVISCTTLILIAVVALLAYVRLYLIVEYCCDHFCVVCCAVRFLQTVKERATEQRKERDGC